MNITQAEDSLPRLDKSRFTKEKHYIRGANYPFDGLKSLGWINSGNTYRSNDPWIHAVLFENVSTKDELWFIVSNHTFVLIAQEFSSVPTS